MEKINLKNHQTKCRICFKSHGKRQKHVLITEDIQVKFFTLTQVNLKSSSIYSNQICVDCSEKLDEFSIFRFNATLWQTQLYEEHPDDSFIKPEILQINVKEEAVEDFDECNFDDNHELLRDNMKELQEPTDESKVDSLEKTKGGRRSRGEPVRKQHRICPDCGHKVMDLTRHWRRTHSKIINFICDLCGYGALMRHRLINHMRNKHLPKENRIKYQCSEPTCDFQSVNKSYLQIHEKTHKSEPSEFKCHCGKEFLSKHILAQHIMMVHERAFKFKCSYCPKAYPCRKSQKEHILTQHIKKDIRDIICEICGKGFITETQLTAHMREVHTEGPIPCEVAGCLKRFHKVSKLKRHMKMHTQEKNYRCDRCTNAYSHASHLYRHQEAVHMGLVFPCEVPGCQTNFRRRDNYRVHLMKSHKDLSPSYVDELMKKCSKPIVLH